MTGLATVLHMNGGDDESSYANNSFFQKVVMEKTTPVLTRSIMGLARQDVFLDDHCFKVADLGCSSGMNTLFLVSNIIDAVNEACQESNHVTPQFQVFLNDLIGNDFNSLFKLLPNFYKIINNDKGGKFSPCFISAVPGSFYDRLFPDKSLHLVHSCYSIHWLSQVPDGIENNKSNTYLGKTSPPNVFQAYKNQFVTDFMKFLQLRYKEIVHGGRMVLTVRGRCNVDPTDDDANIMWELLGISLLDMAKEGMVRETDVNSFNIPFYFPNEDELRNIIEASGLFFLDHIDSFEVTFGLLDTDYTANRNEFTEHESIYDQWKNSVKGIRIITEPLLTSHFGNSIIDVLFKKFGNKVAEDLGSRQAIKIPNIIISLTKI